MVQRAPAKFPLHRLLVILSTSLDWRFNVLFFKRNEGSHHTSLSLTGSIGQGCLLACGVILCVLSSVAALAERNKDKPPSFGEYYPAFKDVCVAIADDNMSVDFYQLLTSLIETPTSECTACKNFFRGFASSCRPKVSSAPVRQKGKQDDESAEEEASGSPSPVVVKKPILPALDVLDAVSALGISLSEDSSLENFLPQIIAAFNKRLLGKGEKDNKYFYTLAAYLTQYLAEEHAAQNQ